MNTFKVIATATLFFIASCDYGDNNNKSIEKETSIDLIFSRNYSGQTSLGDDAQFFTTDDPAVAVFTNARSSYNFFELGFSDDLSLWTANKPTDVDVSVVDNVDTPFGVKPVSNVSMQNASGVRLLKSFIPADVPLADFTERDFEYSIWLYNNFSKPSRVSVMLQNRSPINGSEATLCVIPPKQWVRCSGRLHTNSVVANSLDFSITERQFKLLDGSVNLYITNASIVDITEQITRGLISDNSTTFNVLPKSQISSSDANDINLPIISIGDSIYASPASGVANQQAHSTALGIENLGGYIDARAVGGWSVSDMYNDLVLADPITLDEKLNSLAIIAPGNDDTGGMLSEVPVQKSIVDQIVQLFTDVGNENYLVLGVHGNSVTKLDLETTNAYNTLLSQAYGERFLNTWQKLIEISDPVDQIDGIISARYRLPGDGLHLSERAKEHIVRWSIERLKALGYPKRNGTPITESISYQHSINDSLSYPIGSFDENNFTVVIKWKPGKSQADLTNDNGILSVNDTVDSLLYANSNGVFSKASDEPVFIDPSFEAGESYFVVVRGSSDGGYQIGIKNQTWLWSVEKPFTSYFPQLLIKIGLSAEMNQNFELIEIYETKKSVPWIELNY